MRGPAAALLVLLVAGGPASAAWLQSGHDAARTGAVPPGSGPLWDDVAWMVRIPGSRAGGAHAGLLLDGKAYVLSADLGLEGLDANALWEADLDTAAFREVAALDTVPTNLASDGGRAFVVAGGILIAFALPSGEFLWSWEPPVLVPAHEATGCTNPAVGNGTVYLACSQLGAAGSGIAYVAAVSAETGGSRWLWVKDAREDGAPGQNPIGPLATPASRSLASGISVIGPYVMTLLTEERGGPMQQGNVSATALVRQDSVWTLDEASGRLLWTLNATATRSVGVATEDRGLSLPEPLADPFAVLGAAPTGNPGVAYLKLDALQAVNPARGVEIWRAAIGQEDAVASERAAGFAYEVDGPGHVYVASSQTIYRFDPETRQAVWHYTVDPQSNEEWGGPGLVLDDDADLLYARTYDRVGENNTLYAIDTDAGRPVWRHRFMAERGLGAYFRFSVGEGVALMFGQDGTLWALGRTAASLQPTVGVATPYPAPGEEVRVDLGGTRAGVLGPPTAYRAH